MLSEKECYEFHCKEKATIKKELKKEYYCFYPPITTYVCKKHIGIKECFEITNLKKESGYGIKYE